MEKRLKICIVDDMKTGCFLYRGAIPLDALERRGHKVTGVSPDGGRVNPKEHDIVILSRAYQGNITEMLLPFKRAGVKVVYDCDDAMDIAPPYNLLKSRIENSLPSFYYYLNQADHVTTTTGWLMQHLGERTSRPVSVFPNCIDPRHWSERDGREESQPFRIGFVGSNTHIRDIQIVLQAMNIMAARGEKFTAVFGGFSAKNDVEAWWQQNVDIVGADNIEKSAFMIELQKVVKMVRDLKSKGIEVEWHPVVQIDEFPELVRSLNLDLGVCPLEDTEFNRCKSCIKFYEYSMVGTPVISSNVPPFSDEMDPADMVNAMEDETLVEAWARHMSSLMKQDLSAMAARQKRWVLEHRDIDNVIEDRERLYLDLVYGEGNHT